MRSFLKYWLPVFIWLGIIFVGSTDLMSADHTSRFIEPFLRWLNPNISAEAIAQVHLVVRKLAHLTEYAILGLLLLRALRSAKGQRLWPALFIGLLCAAASAALDEFHQSFVATRTASPVDVMIDICGALCGLIGYAIIRGQKRAAPTLSRSA